MTSGRDGSRGEWANAFGDIARPVESTRFARHSAAEARNQNRARRGALSQAALARAALTNGHVDLDAAVHHAHWALDLAVTVTSSRCPQAITDLRARIQPFHTMPVARDFDERARLALATNHQTSSAPGHPAELRTSEQARSEAAAPQSVLKFPLAGLQRGDLGEHGRSSAATLTFPADNVHSKSDGQS